MSWTGIRVTVVILATIVAGGLTGCITAPESTVPEDGATGGPTAGTERGDDDRSAEGTAPEAETGGTSDREEPFFQLPEDGVVSTPWFEVSSVIFRVRRTQPETVIVLSGDSFLTEFLRLEPNTVSSGDQVPPRTRILVGFGVATDGVPPFTADPEPFRYPDHFAR